MGISHAALWNVMLISTQLSNQQLWSTPFCLSRALQRKMSRCTVPDRQVQPALDSRKADSWRSSGHTWTRMTLVRTCYLDWSHSRWELQKSLPANRNESSGRCGRDLRLPHVRHSQSRGYAALTHIANCPSNVPWRHRQTVRRFGDMTQCDQCDWT